MQDYAAATFGRIPFPEQSFFEATSRSASAGILQSAMDETGWAEQTVLALYRRHLPAIRAAAKAD